jgi:hypothetical protein
MAFYTFKELYKMDKKQTLAKLDDFLVWLRSLQTEVAKHAHMVDDHLEKLWAERTATLIDAADIMLSHARAAVFINLKEYPTKEELVEDLSKDEPSQN